MTVTVYSKILILLLFLSILHPGLQKIHINKDPTTICAENYTVFSFRSTTTHNTLDSTLQSAIPPHKPHDYVIKQTAHHFEIANECLTLSGPEEEDINQWVIPTDLCSSMNIVNVYGYSYNYDLYITSEENYCMFFSSFDSKHHLSLISRGTNFTAEYYTSETLFSKSKPLSCKSTVCHHTANVPYFVRLTSKSKKANPVSVSLVSLQFPVFYTNCRVEQIQPLEHIDGTRIKFPGASSFKCFNLVDEIRVQVINVGILISSIFLVLLLFHIFGMINVFTLCGFFKPDFTRFRSNMSHDMKNPSDITIHPDESDIELQDVTEESTLNE